MSTPKLKVVELFAGVGGFRLGLEGWRGCSSTSQYQLPLRSAYSVIWSNQWEPATKAQHASLVYESRFGSLGHTNADIESIDTRQIPDHDVLVGGFPCQDYSVATTLKNAKGLIGKKGVLWWSIHRILSEKLVKPSVLILENVDRLLSSPSSQRGRDFAIILQSLNELGYAVEWRVINAADYGMPQRRRRIFILAYLLNSLVGHRLLNKASVAARLDWLQASGTLAQAFPVHTENHLIPHEFKLDIDIVSLSETFNRVGSISPFSNTGLMLNGHVLTIKTRPHYEGESTTLANLVVNERVDDAFYISDNEVARWQYLKGGKKETRTSGEGFAYNYSEGAMAFPDALDKPSRTIITGEGGAAASRFKHVIETPYGLRRLLPLELERLNMFPDHHTELGSISDTKRAFFMGNALVVGVVEKIGLALQTQIRGQS